MQSLTEARCSREGENTASDKGSDGDQIRYESPWFAAASALQGDRAASNRARRALTCMAAALRRPQRVGALFVVLCRTPPLQVRLSGSLAGQALRAYFDQRLLGVLPSNRLCQGVLVLPQQRSDYVRGRRRHALRTNLRRATAAGIRCELMESGSGAVEAVEMVTQSRLRGPLATADVNYFRSLLANPGTTVLVARDREDRPRAVLVAVIDETVCLWEWATSNSHEARWALHHHLVSLLIDRGVQYLVSSGEGPFGALGFTTNVQRYQHLVGYELRHVSPARTVRRRNVRGA